MSHIHLRLQLGGVAIQFSGQNAFFRQHIEPLIAAQARQSPHLEGGARDASEGASPDVPATATASRVADFPPLRAPTLAERVAPAPATFQPSSPQNFNQYVRQVGDRARTSDQRLMAFAFYLWNYEKQEEFGRSDVEGFFRTLHDEGLEQTGELLGDLWERRRFLEPGRSEGQWRLTAKGLNYVKNRLLSAG